MVIPIAQILHLLVYVGIMWYGWQSYQTLRKQSWTYLGFGFGLLAAYRIWKFGEFLAPTWLPIEPTVDTLLPLIGAIAQMMAFRFMRNEDVALIKRLRQLRLSTTSGDRSIEEWEASIRDIVRKENEPIHAMLEQLLKAKETDNGGRTEEGR
jgi:hypothetical protein